MSDKLGDMPIARSAENENHRELPLLQLGSPLQEVPDCEKAL